MAKNHIEVKITGDTKGLTSALGDAEGKLGRFGRGVKTGLKAGGIAVAGLGTAAIVAAPKILELGSQLEATAKKAKTVLGGSLGDVESWAGDTAGSLGLTTDQLVGLAANTADLLKPMGFAADEAARMAMQTNDLAGALSAWSGGQVDAAEVSEILTKAYLGEREQLKMLGVSISEADVKARLAAKGQEGLTGAALQQAKALATQELILEKSTDAQEAWADGSMDAIKAQNESQASMERLKESLVKAVYPALEALVPIIEKVAAWLGEKLPPIIERVVRWFRDNWPQIRETVSAVFEGIKTTIQSVWDAIKPIVEGAMEFIRGVIDAVGAIIRGDWGDLWEAVQAIFSGAWKLIKRVVGLAFEGLKKLIGLAWEGIKKSAAAAWEWIKRETGEAVTGLVDEVRKLPGLVVSGLKGLGGYLVSKGAELMRGFKDGMWNFWTGTLWPFIKGLPDRMVRGIGILKTRLLSAGGDLLHGAWTGMKDFWSNTLWPFISGLPGRMVRAVGDLRFRLLNAGKDLIQGLWDGALDKYEDFSGWLGGIASIVPGARYGGNPRTRQPRGRGTSGNGRTITGYADTGGIVPGPIGSPHMIMAHGGETILPTHKRGYGGMGTTWNITVNAGVGTDGFSVGQQVIDVIRTYERANGASWRGG